LTTGHRYVRSDYPKIEDLLYKPQAVIVAFIKFSEVMFAWIYAEKNAIIVLRIPDILLGTTKNAPNQDRNDEI